MAPPRDTWRNAPAPIAALLAACLVSSRALGAPPAPSNPAPAPDASAVPYELTRPPRPPLPPPRDKGRVPWIPRIEIGGDAVWAVRTTHASDTSGASYRPTLGFGLHARWEMLSFLRFTAYIIDADHTIRFSSGALGLRGKKLIVAPVETFSFGARFQPLLRFTPRVTGWLSAGIGWGRMELGRMKVGAFSVPGGTELRDSFEVRERSSPFVEFPLGFGLGIDIIPGWLVVEYEFQGAWIDDQRGSATTPAQAVDLAGKVVEVGGFAPFVASFTQTLGLSLKL